ncbi:MAG: sel1 repeat family protein [Proteobacteria bacterium]|nr:sel1 repeat family protein [Pseudomonadota bacterium]
MKVSVGFAIAALTLGFSSFATAGDFHDGVRVLDSGDSVGAIAHFKRCSDKGEIRCQVAYASFLQRGEGVRQDLQAAFDLYYKAAMSGDATAQLNLGEFYEQGQVVSADPKEAVVWYSLAADQGRGWAQARKDDLVRSLSPEDMSVIEIRIKELTESQKG